jgi:DNA-binding NarL/FixJ family response regulator
MALFKKKTEPPIVRKTNFSHDIYLNHAQTHRILIADDEERKRFEAGGVALANGFDYVMTTCASEAWIELNAHPAKYDMLISDISMVERYGKLLGDVVRGKEGLALVKAVKENSIFKDLEVVVLSGGDFQKEVEMLGAVFAGTKLYLLNEILREKSELYRSHE